MNFFYYFFFLLVSGNGRKGGRGNWGVGGGVWGKSENFSSTFHGVTCQPFELNNLFYYTFSLRVSSFCPFSQTLFVFFLCSESRHLNLSHLLPFLPSPPSPLSGYPRTEHLLLNDHLGIFKIFRFPPPRTSFRWGTDKRMNKNSREFNFMGGAREFNFMSEN